MGLRKYESLDEYKVKSDFTKYLVCQVFALFCHKSGWFEIIEVFSVHAPYHMQQTVKEGS